MLVININCFDFFSTLLLKYSYTNNTFFSKQELNVRNKLRLELTRGEGGGGDVGIFGLGRFLVLVGGFPFNGIWFSVFGKFSDLASDVVFGFPICSPVSLRQF